MGNAHSIGYLSSEQTFRNPCAQNIIGLLPWQNAVVGAYRKLSVSLLAVVIPYIGTQHFSYQLHLDPCSLVLTCRVDATASESKPGFLSNLRFRRSRPDKARISGFQSTFGFHLIVAFVASRFAAGLLHRSDFLGGKTDLGQQPHPSPVLKPVLEN